MLPECTHSMHIMILKTDIAFEQLEKNLLTGDSLSIVLFKYLAFVLNNHLLNIFRPMLFF